MMKKVVILLSTVLPLILCFYAMPGPAKAESGSPLVISFPQPIHVDVEDNKIMDQASCQRINAIVQSGYDAFVMDYPLRSMWLNMSSCNFHCELSAVSTEAGTQYALTKMSDTVLPLPDYANPAGMVDIVNRIIGSFQPTGESLFEKVQSIHDYLCRRVVYEKNAPHVFSAYGALADRKSVCEGYAEAFKLICEKNGIDCLLVVGTATNGKVTEHHEWNMVRMEDDRWYAVDVTWDDVGGRILTDYFLVGSDTPIPSAKNTQFKDNHTPSSDISFTNNPFVIRLTYPELSSQSYIIHHTDAKSSADYKYGASHEYFGKQLSENERAVYDALKKTELPSGPAIDYHEDTEPDITTSPITTDKQDGTSLPDDTTHTLPNETTGTDTANIPDTESSTNGETTNIISRDSTYHGPKVTTETIGEDSHQSPLSTTDETIHLNVHTDTESTAADENSQPSGGKSKNILHIPYLFIGIGSGLILVFAARLLIRKAKKSS